MENLKALVYKGDLTPYQRALAKREFEGMVERLELLEKAVKNNAVLPLVSNSEVFEHYGKPFTSGRDLWDFLTAHYNFTPKT